MPKVKIEIKNTDQLINRLGTFLKEQVINWRLANRNYFNLKKSKIKLFNVNNFEFEVAFLPDRVKSTTASVDKKSLQSRECFLCEDNLPAEQDILFFRNFNFLVNPYPIFERHFTIAFNRHIKQSIANSISQLLFFAKELGSTFALFYNGPECGASAPDHLHFQMCKKNDIPIVRKILAENFIATDKHILINNFPQAIILKNSKCELLEQSFLKLIEAIKKNSNINSEPKLNLISFRRCEDIYLIIFLRAKHRPNRFFLDGENQILLSPAAVDMGGRLILPREKDFEKMNAELIKEIFDEVSLSTSNFRKIISTLNF